MHQMAVDIQKAGAVFGLVDNVIVPDLVVKRARSHGSSFLELAVIGKRVAGAKAPDYRSRARTDRSKAVKRQGRRS
jgi:hypothetical protein